MNKKLFWALLGIAVVAVAGVYFLSPQDQGSSQDDAVVSFKDATYVIEGQPVVLVNGVATTSTASGSASKTVTQYFGNDATGDLNGDGLPDTAFVLTQNGGGSGTFYYIVVALRSGTGYVGTNAVLLGDRIAPQTTQIKDGMLVVNYADRNSDEPMSTQPSVGVTKYLKVKDSALVSVQP